MEARRWIDVPVSHLGRNMFGVDCIGLVIEVGQRTGVLPATDDELAPHLIYGRIPNSERMRASLTAFLVPVEGEHQLADIGFFSWGNRKRPIHTAIMGQGPRGRPTMIHANGQIVPPRVRENGYAEPWLGRKSAFFRYPGLA